MKYGPSEIINVSGFYMIAGEKHIIQINKRAYNSPQKLDRVIA